VVVWAVLVVLVGAIAVLETLDRLHAATGEGERDARRLLPVPVDQLAALEVADAGRLHRFERDAGGRWFYHGVHGAADAAHTHTPDPVLADRIARAVAAFGRTRIERQFSLDGDGGTYGLASPELVVLIYRASQSQPLAQYAVGGVAPDTASRYVMVVGRPGVVTIANYQIENLQSLVQAATTSAGAAPGSAATPSAAAGGAAEPAPTASGGRR
jgi:hypothetical protein